MSARNEIEQSAQQQSDEDAANRTYSMRYRIEAIAGFIAHAEEGSKASKSHYVALKRLNPLLGAQTGAEYAALVAVAERAKLDLMKWDNDEAKRWALIAHGIAVTGYDKRDKSEKSEKNEPPAESEEPRKRENSALGHQLFIADVSEPRVMRLLDSRGDGFVQTLSRLLRLLASRNVKPNWVELGRLVFTEGVTDRKPRDSAENLRLRIAGAYFSAQSKASGASADKPKA